MTQTRSMLFNIQRDASQETLYTPHEYIYIESNLGVKFRYRTCFSCSSLKFVKKIGNLEKNSPLVAEITGTTTTSIHEYK